MLNQLISLEDSVLIKVHDRSCDQCNFRKMKCNKEIPKCKPCANSGLICSWDRPLSKKATFSYQTIETFSIGSRQRFPVKARGKNKETDKKTKKEKKEKILQKEKNTSILFFSENIVMLNVDNNGKFLTRDWNNIVKKWLSNTTTRCEFYHLFTLTGFTTERLEKSSKLLLIDLFNNKLYFRGVVPLVKIKNHFSGYRVKELIHQAEIAFFHYFNFFNPLFTWDSYHNKKRSKLLYFSVWCSGLQLLPESKLTKELSFLLTEKLETLTRTSKMVHSLDTLQAYTIIYCCLRSSKVLLDRMWVFHSASLSLMTSLGLHLTKIKDGSIDELEKVLAYRRLLALDANGIWISSNVPKTYLSFTTNSDLTEYIDSYISLTINCSYSFTKHTIMDCCIIYLSQVSFFENSILFKLYIKRCEFIQIYNSERKKIDVSDILKLLATTENIYAAITKKVLLLKNRLSDLVTDEDLLNNIINQTMTFLYIRYYYCIFLVTSNYCHLYETYIKGRKTSIYPALVIAIKACLQIIKLLSGVGPEPYTMMRCSFLAFASHFIIKYYGHFDRLKNKTMVTAQSLKKALTEAKRLFYELSFCRIAGHQAKSNISLMENLLVFYDVELNP
ncbi:hypothetical protein K502DRAFT_349827 [Neoconidiobolus thromboides FSU 785]|nr:hypothetical protein K502DRAFT_349827 [Neoconidiobolus thromboides FSU 785]